MKHIFLSIVACTALWASACNESANTAGLATAGNTEANAGEAAQLKVMAYNIHHSNPPSQPDSIDIPAIVRVIRTEAPDLVALQEVDVNTERSGPYNQAEEIAKALDMHYYFGKAIDYQGGAYGVAILSKYPLSETRVHRLSTKEGTKGEPRILATALVTLPGGTAIRFGSTHLDAQRAPDNRQLQIDEIAGIAAQEMLPFIIAGDFNATPDTEIIGVLDKHFTRSCQSCEPTIPADNPRKTIDFIAYKHPQNKFKTLSHKVVQEPYASDHLPVVAAISLEN